MAGLTDKQELFCQEYLIDLNASQAAIRAGYSKNTSRQIASELLTKLNIQDRLAELSKDRRERLKVDADWVLARLVEEANADLSDLVEGDEGRVKPVHEWPEIWRKGLVAGIDVESLYEGRGEDREHVGNVTKLKLSDRVKRLELIGRHIDVGAFIEKKEVTGKDGEPLIPKDMGNSDLTRRLLAVVEGENNG